MFKEARVESILIKLKDYEIYFREMMQVDLKRMRMHKDNIVDLDSEETVEDELNS